MENKSTDIIITPSEVTNSSEDVVKIITNSLSIPRSILPSSEEIYCKNMCSNISRFI